MVHSVRQGTEHMPPEPPPVEWGRLENRGGGELGLGESWPFVPPHQCLILSYLCWAGAVQGQRGSRASRSVKGEGLVPCR